MKHTFIYNDENGKVRILPSTKFIVVAFEPTELPDFDFDLHTKYEISDRALKGALCYTDEGYSPDHIQGDSANLLRRFTYFACLGDKSLDICERYLKKLFGRIPKKFYLRKVAM